MYFIKKAKFYRSTRYRVSVQQTVSDNGREMSQQLNYIFDFSLPFCDCEASGRM